MPESVESTEPFGLPAREADEGIGPGDIIPVEDLPYWRGEPYCQAVFQTDHGASPCRLAPNHPPPHALVMPWGRVVEVWT